MTNYNESAVSGTKWTRSKGGTFNNPYQATPSINFQEEDIMVLSDGTIVKPTQDYGMSQGVTAYLFDPSKEFNLLDPSTGSITGTATYGQVFAMLHSLYISLALERDTPVYPPPGMP